MLHKVRKKTGISIIRGWRESRLSAYPFQEPVVLRVGKGKRSPEESREPGGLGGRGGADSRVLGCLLSLCQLAHRLTTEKVLNDLKSFPFGSLQEEP